jgi:hypothetical protein
MFVMKDCPLGERVSVVIYVVFWWQLSMEARRHRRRN